MSPAAVAAPAGEGRALHIPTPAVFLGLLEPSRYKAIYGGRGGAKSHAFADLLIERCMLNPGTRWVCIREIQRSLDQSVKRLIEDKIDHYGLGRDFRVMNTHIETPGDGILSFVGMQSHTAESIKSLEAYDGGWVEEAQSLSLRSLELLRPTIRKETCRHCRRDSLQRELLCTEPTGHIFDPSELWFSWNPRFPSDPVDDFFRGNAPRKPGDPAWQRPPSAIIIESSFGDNPFLPDVLYDEMSWDRQRDPDKFAHVWLGQYERHSESRVFRNWRVDKFDTPSDARFYYGADWGFSVDPSVLVRCFIKGRTLYIDYEAYAVGCEIDNLPALFDKVPGAREWTIRADSARPETISYLNRHGFPKIIPANKGKDSVKEGVIFLQNYDIVIHERCPMAAEEFTLYSYKVDPHTDEILPVLEDKKNHVIDSVRYSVEELRGLFDYKAAGMTSEATW